MSRTPVRLAVSACCLFVPALSAAEFATADGLRLGTGSGGRVVSVTLDGREARGTATEGGFSVRDFAGGAVERGEAELAQLGLRLETRVEERPSHIVFEGRLVDLKAAGDRAVDLVFRLPFDPKPGVLWWPDITGGAEVTPPAAEPLGHSQTTLTFPPTAGTRLRLVQPAGGGCETRPRIMWMAEVEAYGRDQNKNLLRVPAPATVSCDSTREGYSVARVTDGRRNDRWEKDWLMRGWASAESDAAHWIEITLQQETTLSRVDVYWCRERFGFASSRQVRAEVWRGGRWERLAAQVRHEAPRLGDAEKARFAAPDSGASTEVYPFACVTDADRRMGVGLALPPDAPCAFEIGYQPDVRALALTLKFGLSPLPRAEALASQAPFRFVLFRVDGAWGCRDAARRYYELFPALFERVTTLDGLWLLGDPTRIPNPHHYAYREHGEREAELDQLWGIQTCPYVLVGQREFVSEASDPQGAMAGLAELSPELRGYYGPGLKELIDNCSLRRPNGHHHLLLRRRGGSVDGPAVATFPVNPDPSLYADDGRRTAGRQTLDYALDVLARAPAVDGIYVDSLSSWGGYLNARREHFRYTDMPLTHDASGHVVIDNALAHIEFLRALRSELRPRGKILFGNGIRKRRAWAGFLCDVLGVEANQSVYRDASHYAFFRTIAYHKPFLLLYYYRYPSMELPRAAVEEYVQSAIAFGIAPETRPFGKERTRDVDLYDRFIPILRRLGQAGWEPVSHARVSDRELWCERFGSGGRGLFFTVYNPAEADRTTRLSIDLVALGQPVGTVRELVERRDVDRDGLNRLRVPAKSLRVIQIGDAPDPPSLPVLSAAAVREKLLAMREEKWRDAGGLLANGGFELSHAGGRLMHWRMQVAGQAAVVVQREGAHGGDVCLKLSDADDQSYADVTQVFPFVEPGCEYVLRAWVRHPTAAGHPGRVYFQWRSKEKGRLSQHRFNFPRSDTWTEFERRLTPPEGAETLGLSFGMAKRDGGDLWLDDVSLARRPAGGPPHE